MNNGHNILSTSRGKTVTLQVIETKLPGVLLIKPNFFEDPRGFFMETYQQREYAEAGIASTFVQDNRSHSIRNTLRGLHYQLEQPQGKLIYAVTGEIFDVAVDIRQGSPTFGKWTGIILSEMNKYQIYVPEGFAHGFCVMSKTADIIYKCTDFYKPGDEYGILWDDPDLDIDWDVDNVVLSEKDARNKRLADVAEDALPRFHR